MSLLQSKRANTSKSSWGFCVILLSFFIALLLTLLPLPLWMTSLWPLWIILALIFWVAYLPDLINPWLVFLLGLFVDVLQNTYIGEHALVLLIIYRVTLRMSQQIKSLPLLSQLGKIGFIMFFYQLLLFILNGAQLFHSYDILYWFLPIVTSLLLWPWILFLLHAVAVRFYIHRL